MMEHKNLVLMKDQKVYILMQNEGPKVSVLMENYCKNSKIWDTSNNCHNCPKIEKFDVTLH